MIIPLYNLSAHNVMTNTVLDAGTDAKVAKFGRRCLEIIGLAILEPTEVWAGKDHAHGAGVGAASDPLGIPIQRSSSRQSSLAPPGQNGSRAGTPDPSHSPGSSRLSMSSDHSSFISHGYQPTNDPAKISAVAPPTGARKLFGKMFRKKEGASSVDPTSNSPVSSSLSPPKALSPLPEVRTPTSVKPPTDVLLPAVLGLQPTLSAATNPPSGRCVSYVWIVRKWLKVENQGLISGALAKIGREASAHRTGHTAPGAEEWEIRFEWSRGNSKGGKRRRATRRPSMDVGGSINSRTPSRRDSAVLGPDDPAPSRRTSDGVAISIDSPRQSLDVPEKPTPRARSPRSDRGVKTVSLTSTNPSDEDAVARGQQEDKADDSDPEDSETPWTCSLILTHLSQPVPSTVPQGRGHMRTLSSSGAGAMPDLTASRSATHKAFASESGHDPAPLPAPTKLKVATLMPAPHHPKVVCQMKVPFPLPDVEVDYGVLRKRLVLADGSTRSTVSMNRGPGAQPSIMTAEEIKDVVCSTAFWVIVREGFGGLGKKNRKGDGWKIRG